MLKSACTCSALLRSVVRRQPIRSLSTAEKPFYITTPIFYVNAKPHIGHLYTEVLSDVFRRFHLFQGRKAVLLTGTDEHGMKVERAAAAARTSPQAFCDAAAKVFEDLPGKANVHCDRFIRTTDADHKLAVAAIWKKLQDGGYIYKGSHSGWYSVSDETFYPESSVMQSLNPVSGDKVMVSQETGSVVQWTEEENYHFLLSKMRGALLDLYKSNPDFILPQARFDDIVKSVETDLNDLSISRPSSRLTWGIPVPDDPSQTIYVWLDALVNYITAAGYPNMEAMASQQLWPADLQVIGKDIMRFHCIYWPAFLIAAGLPVQKQVLSHAHWTINNVKMSKSLGNVVDPWHAIQHFGVDPVRYYLMRDGRLENDGSYSSDSLVLRFNTELVGGLGNLVQRSLSPVFQTLLESPAPEVATMSQELTDFGKQLDVLVEDYARHLGQERLVYMATQNIVDIMYLANKFVQDHAPWRDDKPASERREAIHAGTEGARVVALLLQPVVPDLAAALLDKLGVQAQKRTFSYVGFGADDDYKPQASRDRVLTLLEDRHRPKSPNNSKAVAKHVKKINKQLKAVDRTK